jgi:hypothetical protein
VPVESPAAWRGIPLKGVSIVLVGGRLRISMDAVPILLACSPHPTDTLSVQGKASTTLPSRTKTQIGATPGLGAARKLSTYGLA